MFDVRKVNCVIFIKKMKLVFKEIEKDLLFGIKEMMVYVFYDNKNKL